MLMSSEEDPEQAEPPVWEVGWSVEELPNETAGEASTEYAKIGKSHRRWGNNGYTVPGES